MIAVCLEEVVRPLREEASTIKLWLARVANHLECVVTSDMAKLFGPCSPVYRSPTPSILTSLATVCTSADSLVPLGTSTTEMHQDSPTEQTLLQTMTSVEDVVLVEDASNDEEAILDAHGTIDDPIFLITIEDNPSYSMVEVKVEEAQMIMEDPPIEVISSPSTKVRNGEELAHPFTTGVIQDYADRLKKLLPLDDLKPLVDLKGHAFLELLAELSLSLC
uniref:Uncharacterized protein n=1 Tax=Setaria viridis TaxID=4556 RepID=A0A4U6U316_SETVI|nr:hypothetical protein SEVIR_6G078900v2 [Setaria viridis]